MMAGDNGNLNGNNANNVSDMTDMNVSDNSTGVTALPAVVPGRGSNGRFTSGNTFCHAPRSRWKKAHNFRNLVYETYSERDVIAVLRELRDAAIRGDLEAIKIFLAYTLGKPHQTVEIRGETRLVHPGDDRFIDALYAGLSHIPGAQEALSAALMGAKDDRGDESDGSEDSGE